MRMHHGILLTSFFTVFIVGCGGGEEAESDSSNNAEPNSPATEYSCFTPAYALSPALSVDVTYKKTMGLSVSNYTEKISIGSQVQLEDGTAIPRLHTTSRSAQSLGTTVTTTEVGIEYLRNDLLGNIIKPREEFFAENTYGDGSWTKSTTLRIYSPAINHIEYNLGIGKSSTLSTSVNQTIKFYGSKSGESAPISSTTSKVLGTWNVSFNKRVTYGANGNSVYACAFSRGGTVFQNASNLTILKDYGILLEEVSEGYNLKATHLVINGQRLL